MESDPDTALATTFYCPEFRRLSPISPRSSKSQRCNNAKQTPSGPLGPSLAHSPYAVQDRQEARLKRVPEHGSSTPEAERRPISDQAAFAPPAARLFQVTQTATGRIFQISPGVAKLLRPRRYRKVVDAPRAKRAGHSVYAGEWRALLDDGVLVDGFKKGFYRKQRPSSLADPGSGAENVET